MIAPVPLLIDGAEHRRVPLKRRTFISGAISIAAVSGGGCSQVKRGGDTPRLDAALFEFLNSNQSTGNRTAPTYGVPGLDSAKIDSIEAQLGFALPSDLRFLLGNVQDPGKVLFPWSAFSMEKYHASIEPVWSGIEFDIEHNAVWLERWGKRPSELNDAKRLAKEDFRSWPRLLPIYGHRFLAADPCLPSNPIFSIVQTDIIYYGANLPDYLVREFCSNTQTEDCEVTRRIRVWSDFAERTDGFKTQ